LTEGNTVADYHTLLVTTLNIMQQAKMLYDFFHQNAKALRKQFSLTQQQAHDIVWTCANCQQLAPLPSFAGVNLRGLTPDEFWQSDVTHIMEFGCLRYVHVSVDLFSHFVVATAH
ncbi:POK10 protein, partial [Chroicocephalus maculipennis]|nr:POK10 protein [Chroicocephalus maculipennis]